MSDPLYPLFSIASFLGFVCALIPLSWHLEAWNSGTCFYMIWALLACLNQFINSIIWANDAINRAPVWCDISTRITIGASIGIPAASMCIMRRLYSIARVQAVAVTQAEKLRIILIDSLICILFPMIVMVLAYVVQGHRFNIYEEIGCYPDLYNTLPTYFLVHMWPIALGLISIVYCVLILRSFLKRQAQFTQFLSSNSTLTVGRYFRLMALACIEMLCTVPLAIFVICLNTTAQPLEPWVSWADTHYQFSRVGEIPSVIWHSNHLLVISIQLSRWATPVCALTFFIFFGFAEEARKNYRTALTSILSTFRFSNQTTAKSTQDLSGLRHLTLPTFGSMSQGSLPPYFSSPPRYNPQQNGLTKSPTSPLDEKLPYPSPVEKSTFGSSSSSCSENDPQSP